MPVRRLLPLLVAAALPCAASAAAVVRGPFLQQTDATSTLVVVRTDVAAAVEVSAAAPGGTITARSEGRTDHVLRLAGLPPASATAYQVTVDGAAAKSGVVRTPGAPGTEAARHAVLGVIGDFGTGGPVEIANGNQLAARGVEAVLTVGDNAYPDGAAGDWDPMLFEPLAGLLAKTTFWPVPGDHEYKVPYAKGYTDAFELPSGPQGERYYAFDWGDLHVVALDSNCIVPLDAATMGCDAATMVAWLDDDLARSTASWKVVLIHRPALATGKYGVYPQIPAALFPILEARGVDLVLQGHNHLYERSWPARGGALAEKDYDHPTAPVYVTSGGGGDWLYDFVLPAAPWTAYREKTAQHLVLTLDGGTLRVESVRPDGKVHDQFELVKDVAPIAEPPPGTPPPPGAPELQGCASGAGAAGSLLGFAAGVAGLLLLRRARRLQRAAAHVAVDPARGPRRARRLR